ncbi:MAG TPA: MerR family transcriptional regulator [Chthoniobacterales bacterium]|nr:MerR family transcriptional regulator [Chthoniobacterales bacterium]
MRIGELARSVHVTVETIRYYQRIGLLGLPAKPYGGTRSYRFEDLQRLRSIRRAQQIVVFQEAVAQRYPPATRGPRSENKKNRAGLVLAEVDYQKLIFKYVCSGTQNSARFEKV